MTQAHYLVAVTFSRRHFLAAAGSAAALAACGSDSPKSGGNTPASTGASGTDTPVPSGPIDAPLPDNFAVVQRFPAPLFVPGEVRLPVSIADNDKMVSGGPATINGWIEDFNKVKIGDVVGIRRADGIATPYWEFRAQIPKAIVYTLRLEGDDGYGASFEVYEPGDVEIPLSGKQLPPFDTPTVDNHRGVEPYCTRTPKPCPFHDITLTEALKSGKPVAYMVGTPAHCQTGTCAPGLEFLIKEHERVGDKVVMVHADVYTDDTATTVAEAVNVLRVNFEPLIYFCSADGTIVDHVEGVWDASELTERIDKLIAG